MLMEQKCSYCIEGQTAGKDSQCNEYSLSTPFDVSYKKFMQGMMKDVLE